MDFVTVKKAVLQFCLKHWKEILLVLLSAGIFFKMQSDMNELQKAYETARESYEKQISGLQENHEEEIMKREAAMQTYRDNLEELQRKYQEDLQRLRQQANQRQEDLTDTHTERPAEIISEIENQFGFEYVE